MKKWKHKKKMFPEQENINFDLKYEDLDYSDYSFVNTNLITPARNTTIKEEEIIWYRNGNVERKVKYDVFPEDIPGGISALSCYGNKMLIDWKKKNKNYKENNENVRYNYTGIK